MKWACFLFITVFTSTLGAGEIPLEYFVKQGDYLDLKLSPDGKHIAARARADNRVFLVVLKTETMEPAGGLRPENNDIIHTVNWVSNERLVFEYAEQVGNFDRPVATGELYAVNIDSSYRRLIYGFRAGDSRAGGRISIREDNYATQEILSYLNSDSKHILIIEYPWSKRGNLFYDDRKSEPTVSRLNVFNGKKRAVEVLPYAGAQALSTQDGEIRFITWRDEEGVFSTAFRHSNDAPWQDLNTALGVAEDLTPLGLSKDSSKVFLRGSAGDKGISTLYQLDLATGAYKEVFDPHETDIEDYILDETGMPAVGITVPGKTGYVYANAQSHIADVHKMLADAFAGQTAIITSRTDDGSKFLVHVSSDVNPGEYYLFDRDTLKARFLWANNSWIDPNQLNPMTPFTFDTADGTRLNGYLTLPELVDDSGRPPLVVLIHGGPHQPGTRDYWAYNPEVQMLSSRGFAVLQVNFRGSSGYGTAFMESGYREWGGKMIDDITDAANWAIDQGYVADDKVCVYGASYGGYAALMSAVKAPDLYQCAIGYVGIYDLEYMFSESDIPNNWGGEAYLERVLGSDPERLKEFSPINYVDEIKASVMLIHGAQDKRVPEINSEALYEALDGLGRPPVYLRYKQAGHGVYNEDSRLELYEGLVRFLEGVLTPPG